MRKIFFVVIICVLFLCLTGCNETISDSSNNNSKTTNQIEAAETDATTKGNVNMANYSKANEMKVLNDKNQELKAVTLTKEEKDKLFSKFLNKQFNIYLTENNDLKIPSETKITQKIDNYNDVCYSIYKYNKDKLYAFLLREKPDPTRSSLPTDITVYEGLLLIPVDKVYTIEDFKDIVINKSDLSDVKKIYKYADMLFEQELQFEESKKRCSIDILSKGSGITISFKKKRGKYIVTNIEDNTDGWLVSKIADVDKNFD